MTRRKLSTNETKHHIKLWQTIFDGQWHGMTLSEITAGIENGDHFQTRRLIKDALWARGYVFKHARIAGKLRRAWIKGPEYERIGKLEYVAVNAFMLPFYERRKITDQLGKAPNEDTE